MGLRDMLARFSEQKQVLRSMETEDRAREKLEQKKLSANERELNSVMKKKREENIKKVLDQVHKQETNEYWHKDVVNTDYLFKEKGTLLHQPSIMHQKNLFATGKKVPI